MVETVSITDADLNERVSSSRPTMAYSARNVILDDQKKKPVATKAVIMLKRAQTTDVAA